MILKIPGVQKRSSFSWKIDEHPWLQIAPPRTHWVAISCQFLGLHSETSLLQTHHISTNLGHLWCEILGAVLGGPSPTCFTVHPKYRRWVGLTMIASLLSEFKHSSYFILYTFPKSNKQNNNFSAFSLFSHDFLTRPFYAYFCRTWIQVSTMASGILGDNCAGTWSFHGNWRFLGKTDRFLRTQGGPFLVNTWKT